VVAKPASTRKVTTPPVYKTVQIKEIVTPPTTRSVPIPAKYKTVMKRVVATPAKTRTVKTPAVYTTVKIKKLIQPASEKRQSIPATYKTVTKKKKIAEGYAKWEQIVCKSSITRTTIRKVQEALQAAGYYKGPIDGVWGSSSRSATRAYQKAKGLPVAGLSVATMQSLGIY